MDYKDIIENAGKYHYVLVVGRKAGILSSDNNSSNAKKEGHKKIKDKGDKLEGQLVVRLKISEVSSKLLKSNEESKIKTIGGPILVNIQFNQIKNKKFVKLNDYKNNNKIFITNDFIHKKKKIGEDTIKLIASSAHNNKLSTDLFVINKIDMLIKN